jgi:hypothetical protein
MNARIVKTGQHTELVLVDAVLSNQPALGREVQRRRDDPPVGTPVFDSVEDLLR